MEIASKHIIKQQILDITIPYAEDHEVITTVLSEVYKKSINEMFEDICDGLVSPNEVVRIDSLTVDLGHLEFEKLATDFPKAVKNAVRAVLYQQIRDHKVSPVRLKKVARQNNEMALITYLKSGLLPWYYEGSFEKLKLEFSNKEIIRTSELRNTFKNPDSRKRAVHFFKEKVLFAFLRETLSNEERMVFEQLEVLKSCLAKLESIHKEGKNKSIAVTAKKLLKEISAKEETYVFILEQFIQQLAGGSNEVAKELSQVLPKEYRQRLQIILHAIAWKKDDIFFEKEIALLKSLDNSFAAIAYTDIHFEARKSEFEIDTKFQIEERLDVKQGGIVVPNAGLILIWPYLEAFFTGLGLMRERSFIAPDSAIKAVHLLHYLVFKTEVGDETEWLLNKILCGIESTEFIPEHFDLSPTEKEECDHLLNALIGNWPALKNTGPDSLRQTFLQRDGLIILDENGWTLKVERKAFDVLLDRLTWAISVVKMPWNAFLIHTEW